MIRPTFATSVVALTLLAGCAGWRGDAYYAHRLPLDRARKEASFRFGLPGDGWKPVRNLKNTQVAWVNPDVGGVIELHAQCDDQGDSSLDQYTDHLRIDWTSWRVDEQEETRLADRDALRTVVTAELDGIVRRNEFWVLKKNGCLFDLRYSAAPKGFERGQPAFANVVQGFVFPIRGKGS